MNKLYDLVRVTTPTTGTGTVTLGTAVAGWLTFAQGGVVDADVVTYCIIDGLGKEIGQGTYTAAGTTLSRDTVYRSTGAANVGKITLSGSAQVIISPAAEDFAPITLGSTAIKLGDTATTVAGLTLSGGTLSGATTLPGSGTINASGDMGLGAGATAKLAIGGTYTTANGNLVSVGGTFASSATVSQSLLNMSSTFAPSGTSLTQIFSMLFSPTLNSTALNISSIYGVYSDFTFGLSYTGTITNMFGFAAANITSLGGSITNMNQYAALALTNGDGLTTGTVTNRQFNAAGITAGAAGGTVNNRGFQITMPSGTAPASGTVNNRGIYITGNGGAAPGGTGVVNNFAFFSDSTAPMQIGGMFNFLGSTSAFPALKRSAARLQHRLADDSAFCGIDALDLILNGATSGTLNIKAAAVAGSGVVTFPAGTTDFSATGATGAFVKQASAGAAFTVAVPTIAEVAGLGTGVATFLGTPSSANLLAAVTDETGTGVLVFGTAPTISQPNIVGTTTNDNAAALSVGQYLSGSATGVSLTSPNTANIVTLSLTAGDWDVEGTVKFNPAATTTSTFRAAAVTLTTATMPTALADATAWSKESGAITTGGTGPVLATGVVRVSLASTTNVFLVGAATFATSTMTADGIIKARRRR